MKKLSEKGRRALKRIYSALGAIAVLFLLSACPPSGSGDTVYPYLVEREADVRGQVKSIKTGEPIPGICFWIKNTREYYLANTYGITNTDGNFFVYEPFREPVPDNYTIIFSDIDGPENGGPFRQYTINLTREQCEASKETPLIIELEEGGE